MAHHRLSSRRRFRRGIYILPTLFTVGNLFCGFFSVVQASNGNLGMAAMLVVIAGVLDGLDGRIARLTRTQSEFGLQFDSMADIISFGLAPAYLIHQWVLEPLGRFGWFAAFFYLVCAATRLARFNIQTKVVDTRYFVGLPSPMAAAALASVVYALPEPPGSPFFAFVGGLGMMCVGGLMVSRFRYRSFKELDLADRRSYFLVLPLAGVLVAFIVAPDLALPVALALYVLSGPAVFLWGWWARRAARRDEHPDPSPVEAVDGSRLR